MHARRSLCMIYVLVFSIFLSLAAALDIAERTCESETGPHSLAHEHVLDRLNGRKIVFIGDSVSRYQYLELAFYAIYGLCPDQNAPEYILSERSFDRDWNEFYAKSSAQLNVEDESGRFKTQETCFCSRQFLTPGSVMEQRAFHYEDVQGRGFSLFYVQYFNEAYGPLPSALLAAKSLHPTDVLVNVGVWLHWAADGCALWEIEEGQAPPVFNEASGPPCPSMPALCEAFAKNAADAEAPFKLWWNSPVPSAKGDELIDILGGEHQLNAAVQCDLTDDVIIDRKAAIDAIQPERSLQRALWWEGDSPHVHAAANHAFNSALLDKLPPNPPAHTASGTSPLWRMFQRAHR